MRHHPTASDHDGPQWQINIAGARASGDRTNDYKDIRKGKKARENARNEREQKPGAGYKRLKD